MSEDARILLIEDNHDLRQTLAQALQRQGYLVNLLPDGSDAVQVVGEFCPDVVVTDILMPNKEGIEIIHELQKVAPSIPIIAISGGGRFPADELLKFAKSLGVRRSLTKPFRIADFTDAVAEVLAESTDS